MTHNTTNRTAGRWWVLLALSVLLILVNVLYWPVSTWQPVREGEAGDLLYAAGFDGFTDEWPQYEGRLSAQINDGELRIGVEVNDTIYSAPDAVYADFDVSVTLRPLAGELQNDGQGIIFRLNEATQNNSCLRRVPLLCSLDEIGWLRPVMRWVAPPPEAIQGGYYVFLISNDGYYSIWRSGDNPSQIEQVTVWHDATNLLETGLDTSNRIRVVGEGDQFRFYLNGQQVELCVPFEGEQPTGNADNCLGEVTTVWQDDDFATGKLGLIVSGTRTPGTVVAFDNFVVTMPESDADTEGDQA